MDLQIQTAKELLGQLAARGSTGDSDAISLIGRILQDQESRLQAMEVARRDGEPARSVGHLDVVAGHVEVGHSGNDSGGAMDVSEGGIPFARPSLGRKEQARRVDDLRDHLDGRVAWLESSLEDLETRVQGKLQDIVQHISVVALQSATQSRAEVRKKASPPRTAPPRGPPGIFDDGMSPTVWASAGGPWASAGSSRTDFRAHTARPASAFSPSEWGR